MAEVKKDKDPKMKTAFIRVSSHNYVNVDGEELEVIYDMDGIMRCVNDIVSSLPGTLYYVIEHNGEPGDENKHYHIVWDGKGKTVRFSTLKKRFPWGRIETAKSVKNCVQYLVHLNDLSKRTYEWSEVRTNDTYLDKYKVMRADTVGVMTKNYIDRIMAGQIREYNFSTEIDPEVYTQKRTVLMNALELYRQRIAQNKNRNIRVVVCQGGSGSGKTTYGKAMAEKTGKSLCISSGSNDPWQDYKGEDILLLDELRSEVFSLSDLLKILDNHTVSTARARYNNKLFLGDTIIITTNEEWQDWYKDADETERNALKRRASLLMRFTKNAKQYESTVETFKWNVDAAKYEYVRTEVFDYSKYITPTVTDDTDFFSVFN